MRKKNLTDRSRLLIASLLLALAPGLRAETTVEPWILLEEARALIADRENPDMGEALRFLRQAIEQQTYFPEAELAIGDIYLREGALELAETQFRKVLRPEYLASLRVPEDRYRVLYSLADIQEIQGQYAEMQQSLEEILQDQPEYADKAQQRFRNSLLRTYLTRGLDHTLRLYRLQDAGFALAAHAKLGWFDYRTGRYEPASLQHSLFALDTVVTEAMEELRRTFPTYEYGSLADFLRTAVRREAVRSYLTESGFFRIAYYLAAAASAAGYASRAAELWRVLADGGWDPAVAGDYPERARRQLKNPATEPLINPSARRLQ
jgi:tetratricopeptide (TPR) repeat protein